MHDTHHTVGSYLATRLEQAGLKHYFAVPGDYNLILLDELLKNKQLTMINCCNELNGGYAADGYSRAHGLAALVVTYSVGGLSAINAIAGAYAEDLPIIVISGSPGATAEAQNQIVHHALGIVNYRYVKDMFSYVTSQSVTISRADEAPNLIDQAIITAIKTRKPVYIEIACNIAALTVSNPCLLEFTSMPTSDKCSLDAAVEHASSLLNNATKPVVIGGVKLRSWQALEAFDCFLNSSQYAVAVMPDAKGFVSEQNPQYMGIYWGPVSSPGCAEVIESSDLAFFAGTVFTDYSTAGYTMLMNPEKMVNASINTVTIAKQVYTHIALRDFLGALAQKIKPNRAALDVYKQFYISGIFEHQDASKPELTRRQVYFHIQALLTAQTTVIVETGDAWFNGSDLVLPAGCNYELQMQYGSIGWSVGATLGYALATKNTRRVIALIGDGAFQMGAQELSTMIRYRVNPIIFIVNNGIYLSEAAIHDGQYNTLKNWNYSDLVAVFNSTDGNGCGYRVKTEAELKIAIEKAIQHTGLSVIEVILKHTDCNKKLLEWGSRVSANNNKPPALL